MGRSKILMRLKPGGRHEKFGYLVEWWRGSRKDLCVIIDRVGSEGDLDLYYHMVVVGLLFRQNRQ